jgi:hypothetical protein
MTARGGTAMAQKTGKRGEWTANPKHFNALKPYLIVIRPSILTKGEGAA